MIYTITFNPSLDYVVEINEFNINKINRNSKEFIFPGGKGINVSTMLNNLGYDTKALGFIGGFSGNEIVRLLNEKHINNDFIKCEGNSRINVKIHSSSETEINGLGPIINDEDINKLYKQLDALNDNDILVLSGSIQKNLKDSMYADIMKYLCNKNIKVIVDATKNLLMNTLEYKPFLIKPNNHELEEIFNVTINNLDEVIPYANSLKEKGARNVLVSFGEKGALLLDEEGNIYKSKPPVGKVLNSVGAGDSMVAGFIASYLSTSSYKQSFYYCLCAGSASAFGYDLAGKKEIDDLFMSFRKEN